MDRTGRGQVFGEALLQSRDSELISFVGPRLRHWFNYQLIPSGVL